MMQSAVYFGLLLMGIALAALAGYLWSEGNLPLAAAEGWLSLLMLSNLKSMMDRP